MMVSQYGKLNKENKSLSHLRCPYRELRVEVRTLQRPNSKWATNAAGARPRLRPTPLDPEEEGPKRRSRVKC